MTDEQETASMQVIEFCRHFNRRMAERQAALGARMDDIAIAGVASAVDLASCHVGDTPSAIAWVRRALDVMEAGLPLTVETLQ